MHVILCTNKLNNDGIFFLNGLFFCLCSEPYEPKPVLGAALTVVRGKLAPMDLVRVETRSQVRISHKQILMQIADLTNHSK